WLYRWFPATVGARAIVRPETAIRWHRLGFRAYWRWRSSRRVGRPKVSVELRAPHSRDEPSEPAVGCPAHPRRAAQAGLCGRPVDGGQVHGPTMRAAIARLEDLPAQSRPA